MIKTQKKDLRRRRWEEMHSRRGIKKKKETVKF